MTRVLLALLLLAPARAHSPTDLSAETVIEDSTTSYAIYGHFETGDEVFKVLLDFPTDFAAPFEVLTPHRRKWADLRPAYAVVGPGLPAPTDDELAFLPEAPPDGWGVYVERNDAAERYVIFESFARGVYWSSRPVAVPLMAGENEIWVWSPDGDTGEVVMAFGVEESFGEEEE